MKLMAVVLVMMVPGLTVAEIYRWVDESGAVHYGDRAVDPKAVELNLESSPVRQKENSGSSDKEMTREEKRERLLDAMQEDRAERNRLSEEDKQKKKVKKIKCAQLKDKLRRMRRASGLYNLDENGNRRFLSKEQKNKSQSVLTKTINKHCR